MGTTPVLVKEFLNSSVGRSVGRAIQLFVGIAIATVLKPLLSGLGWWEPLVVLLCAAFAAVAVEVLTFLLWGGPRLDIRWSKETDARLLQQIDLELRSDEGVSLTHRLEISVEARTLLGIAIVSALCRSGSLLRIMILASPVEVIVNRGPREADGRKTVTENAMHGLDMELRQPSRPTGVWSWAELQFHATDFPTDTFSEVKYEVVGDSRRTRIAARFVTIAAQVGKLRFRGK